MAIKCISKNCPFVDTNPDNCHFIDCCDFAVEQPTNADRIRGMKDEELAEHLVDIGWDCNFCEEHLRLDNDPLLRGEKCDEKCSEHCLEWLQQPAE